MTHNMDSRLALSIGSLLAAAALAACARDGKDPGAEKKSAVADLALRNGAIYHLRWRDGAPLEMLAFNDTSHLRKQSASKQRPSTE